VTITGFIKKRIGGSAAGFVGYYAEKDDLILFNSNFVEIPFNYYFRVYEDQYRLQVEKQGLPLDLFDSGILEPEMTADDIPGLVSLLRTHDRVWLVYSHDGYTDPMRFIPKTLARYMQRLDFCTLTTDTPNGLSGAFPALPT
jgi:mannosyltransferase